ncbi:MAG: nuclear transport factor 2 family protein [Acidobacteria bacterium]|nr:nuclear transport factor 2 family protein [Acidobacteriota bacterium]
MTTTPEGNKQRLQAAFKELAEGRGGPFVDLMAEDFSWVMPGRGTWSGVWRGKQVVREELFAPLFARFAGTYRNTYCYVCEFGDDGMLHELTEYMDNEHAAQVLGPP